jgi:RNA polymerase sigma factor (sigma-70 family)
MTRPALRQTRPYVIVMSEMHSEHPEDGSTLLRVVATVTSDRCIQEDLLQEAVIHLWQLKSRRPGQSASWYFKSCQLHLLNLLRKGRSIDSLKHRKRRVRLSDPAPENSGEGDDLNEVIGHSETEESVFAQVSARDILTSLCQWLDPPDRLILDHLAEGLSAREIASRLQLSHTSVIRRQRKIASVAVSLGLVPSSNAHGCPRKNPLRPLPARSAKKNTS